MGVQLIEKTVDDTTYKIAEFGTTEALKTLTRLSKILGPSFSIAISGAKIKDKSAQSELFGKAILELTQRLDEEEVVGLCKKLTECCLRGEGAKINFEIDFKGKLGHLFKLLKAVLEVQYGNFFQEIGSFASELDTSSLSETVSTGESGE